MEIKLKLREDYDVVELYQMLCTKRNLYVEDNYRHTDMIRLLDGNENNEVAKERLRSEKDSLRWNNEKIEFIENLIKQLEPIVDEVLGMLRK